MEQLKIKENTREEFRSDSIKKVDVNALALCIF